MAIIETKHTGSRINKVKSDLIKTITVISCISMILFLAYYIYLMTLNLNEIIYLIAYSGLIALILLLFVVELSLKENKKLLKNEKRLVTEKKRKVKKVIKVLKFSIKAVLVGLAIYETITNFNLKISNIINICSAIILLTQILIEIIVNYIIKQIDYFRLSIELDFKDSNVLVKKVIGKLMPMKELEEDVILSINGDLYSLEERKMIVNIQDEARKYEKEKREKEKMLRELEKQPKISFFDKILRKK